MSLVIPFEAIEERARERVGGMQALVGRLPQPKSAARAARARATTAICR